MVPGDLRSYGGGNGLPRTVKQSPEFSRILEEDEEDEQLDDDKETNKNEVSFLLVRSHRSPPLSHHTCLLSAIADSHSTDHSNAEE